MCPLNFVVNSCILFLPQGFLGFLVGYFAFTILPNFWISHCTSQGNKVFPPATLEFYRNAFIEIVLFCVLLLLVYLFYRCEVRAFTL